MHSPPRTGGLGAALAPAAAQAGTGAPAPAPAAATAAVAAVCGSGQVLAWVGLGGQGGICPRRPTATGVPPTSGLQRLHVLRVPAGGQPRLREVDELGRSSCGPSAPVPGRAAFCCAQASPRTARLTIAVARGTPQCGPASAWCFRINRPGVGSRHAGYPGRHADRTGLRQRLRAPPHPHREPGPGRDRHPLTELREHWRQLPPDSRAVLPRPDMYRSGGRPGPAR